MNFLNRSDCPACGAIQVNEFSVSPKECPAHENIFERWVGLNTSGYFFPYRQCSSCNLLYTSRFPDGAMLDQLYSSMPDNEHSSNADLEFLTKKEYAKTVVNLLEASSAEIGSNLRMLELGADNGTFLKALALELDARFPDCAIEAVAVEPNISMTVRLTEAGFTQVHRSLDEIPENDPPFDLVIGIHVLDHMLELKGQTRRLCHLGSRSCGYFFVTHNYKSLLAKALSWRWPAYCVQHPHLFDPVSASHLLEEGMNLRELKLGQTANMFTVGYLLTCLKNVFFSNAYTLPDLFPVRLKLGNIFFWGVKQ